MPATGKNRAEVAQAVFRKLCPLFSSFVLYGRLPKV
jgi:hypothetical protein